MAPRKSKATKPAAKPAARKLSASKSRKRPASKPVPERYVMSYTSQASRRRRQPTCSMASLRTLETEVVLEETFVGLFGEKSDNHYTWGKTEAKPIMTVKRKGGRSHGPRLNKLLGLGIPPGHFPDSDEEPELKIPNSPERSHLLRLSLEIRERIYSYLLMYKRPIIVQHDWRVVEHKTYEKICIILVCKQISAETLSFLYKNNAFRAVLRPPPTMLHYRETFSIQPKFVPLFKNVIIQCDRDCYNLEWFEKACKSVKTLVDANVALDALTIVTFPQHDGLSEIAEGMEVQPITFADFFHASGDFMETLKKLNCKVINVVVKKIDNHHEEPWRLLISLNLKYLHAGRLEKGLLTNADTIRLAKSKYGGGREGVDGIEEEIRGGI